MPISNKTVVYILDLDSELSEQQICRIKSYLPDERIASAEKYRRKKDSDACLASFFLLAYGLRKLGIEHIPEIKTGEYGKPFFPDCDIRFNISHCDKAVCCIISDQETGVDVQDRVTDFDDIISYSMTEKEAEQIYSSKDRPAAFTRLWCMKEAYLKFRGTGLNYPLNEIEFLNTEDNFCIDDCLFTLKCSYDYSVCACTLDDEPVFIKKIITEYLDDIN